LDPATISAFFTQFPDRDAATDLLGCARKIMWINILLSGDTRLSIAMACRGLPPRQRFWA